MTFSEFFGFFENLKRMRVRPLSTNTRLVGVNDYQTSTEFSTEGL